VPVVERATDLAADVDMVWNHVTTASGVNDELRPWLRMTVPRGWRTRSITEADPGVRIGRSWILLLGVVPFDHDDLTLVEIGPHHFVERSPLLSAATWQHERSVEPTPAGCRLRDRLTFEPRPLVAALPGGTRLHRAVISAIFRHRHRRLVRRFAPAGGSGRSRELPDGPGGSHR
jgi:ligand-binding SRPBCC domain-containing protein